MNKKMIWVIVILVIVVIAFVMLKKGGVIGKEEGIKVSTEKVTKRTIIETVNASGKVYPEIEVKVSPDISGEITELTVNEGDSVRRGQILARIYADIYQTQRDQSAAGVAQSQAMLSNSTASLVGLKATLDNLKLTYERQKKLFDSKVISRSELEQAEQAYRTAEANYNAAREGLKSGEASVRSAQAQLERANKDISRTVITAPMDGVISLMNVKKGERVAGNSFNVGTEMMRVADMRSIEVRVDVGENDIPKVKLGDTAIVEVDAYTNRKFKGIVYKIANPNTLASATGVSSNADVTNYKVHIRLLPSSYADMVARGIKYPFRPGMSASADIQTQTKKDVISVALNGVTTRDSKNDKAASDKKDDRPADDNAAKSTSANDGIDEVVFVLQKDGKVKKIKVKTGIQDLNNIEVLEGLAVGDEVVTGPYATVSKTLQEGTLVQVVPKERLFEEKKP